MASVYIICANRIRIWLPQFLWFYFHLAERQDREDLHFRFGSFSFFIFWLLNKYSTERTSTNSHFTRTRQEHTNTKNNIIASIGKRVFKTRFTLLYSLLYNRKNKKKYYYYGDHIQTNEQETKIKWMNERASEQVKRWNKRFCSLFANIN